jgi:protein-S-isoprenylcysteine O-methyltransferase Ste14
VLTHPLYLLLIVNFSLIGALPFVFFRRGAFNARWLLTASPLGLGSCATLAAWSGMIDPWSGGALHELLANLGVVLSAISFLLIGLAMGANRIPLARWHQSDDAPVEIVSWGPYAWVRHPFYTSFLAALAAGGCIAPSVFTIVPGVLGATAMGLTARGEERRLLASSLGHVYAGYAAATGRFVPGIGKLRWLAARQLVGAGR